MQGIDNIYYETEYRREWCTSKGKPSTCFLFARKFTRPAALRLLNMVSFASLHISLELKCLKTIELVAHMLISFFPLHTFNSYKPLYFHILTVCAGSKASVTFVKAPSLSQEPATIMQKIQTPCR